MILYMIILNFYNGLFIRLRIHYVVPVYLHSEDEIIKGRQSTDSDYMKSQGIGEILHG
jgi:hypothetical protein